MMSLYLPELREMLAVQNAEELGEFCTALHPARTADFMDGLSPQEAWQVLSYTDEARRAEIFSYFPREFQIASFETLERRDVGRLLAELPSDERVDILKDLPPEIVDELLPLVPADDRRDILRLKAFPEATAGAVMTTAFARLSESQTVAEALSAVRRQVEQYETIYYLYVVDEFNHLRGLVSLRELLSAKNDALVGDLMQRDVISVRVDDDQEDVARTLARYDFLAIPVVDRSQHLMGIVTHDDVIDVVRDEATEDAHRIAAIEPLRESYLETRVLTLAWKRGVWLGVLFMFALTTAVALRTYQAEFTVASWLILFVPLVVSTGGNSGSQSATLIITALSTGELSVGDWLRVVRRELSMGMMLGGALGTFGFTAAVLLAGVPWRQALVLPVTLMLVVVCGTMCGSLLPLLFRRLGLDPALMSTPMVAGIIDVLGIIVYMNVAMSLL